MENIGIFKLIIVILSLHGFFLAALMALGQLMVSGKSVKNLLYLDLFIILGMLEVHMILFESGNISRYAALQQLNIPALYALGPIMYFFSHFSLNKNYRIRTVHFAHYITPVLAYLAALLIVITTPADNSREYMEGFFYNRITFYLWEGGSFVLFLYLASILIVLKRSYVFARGTIRVSPHARVMLIVYGLIVSSWLSVFLSIFLGDVILVEIAMLCITAVIIFLFLINFRYPHYYQNIQRAVEAETSRRSHLAGVNTDSITARLHQAMDDDEMYADETISLPALAGTLGLSSHQLSELINDRFGMNFTTYINTKRVDRAKQLLLVDRDSSVLSIAFEVGFKSKSAFNEAFKKITGESPSSYRRNNS